MVRSRRTANCCSVNFKLCCSQLSWCVRLKSPIVFLMVDCRRQKTYIHIYFSGIILTVNQEKESNESRLLVWAVGHSGGLLEGETHPAQTQVCHMGRHWWRHTVPEFQHGAASVTAGQSCPLRDSALPSSSALSWPSAWTFPMNRVWFHVLLFCFQEGH